MKHSTREPDVLRLLIFLPLLQILFIFILRRPVEAALGIDTPVERWLWWTLTVPLFLLAYASIPWWRPRLGRVYLPSYLVITSIYIILDKYLTLVYIVPPAQQELTVLILMLRLWVTILLVALLVAWQYSQGWVLFTSLALCLADGVLSLPFLKPGTPFFSLMLIVVFTRLVFVTSVAVGAHWLVNRQRQQRAALIEANRKLAQYAAAAEQLAISQERIRLARELHDTLAHSLSGLAVQLEAVEALWEANPGEARQILDQARRASQSGLTEARRSLQALRASPLEDLGLGLALRVLAREAAARASLRLDLDVQSHLQNLAPEVEQCIYRVAQESLTNVARHADAKSLRVALRFDSGALTLTIADDGRGFDPAAVNVARYGLQGLRERAEMVGAVLHVTSSIPGGTLIRLVVPPMEAGT
jgi:signal transduction histidine kinase